VIIRAALIRGGALVTAAQIGQATGTISPATAAALVLAGVLGTGILAYTLGMRHAFDADHIAAIDNTTRKLVGEGKRPLSTGFFFSLGHSSIVFVLALLLNFGIGAPDDQVRNGSSGLHTMTGIIGTGVSGTFLYLIAALNVVVLAGIVKVFREMRNSAYDDAELEEQLAKRGLMNQFLGPLARRVDTRLQACGSGGRRRRGGGEPAATSTNATQFGCRRRSTPLSRRRRGRCASGRPGRGRVPDG
jgi:high-affinity nickel permease